MRKKNERIKAARAARASRMMASTSIWLLVLVVIGAVLVRASVGEPCKSPPGYHIAALQRFPKSLPACALRDAQDAREWLSSFDRNSPPTSR